MEGAPSWGPLFLPMYILEAGMKMKDKDRKRIVIDITVDQKEKLERYFKWGDLSPFFRFLIDDLMEIMEDPKVAQQVMGAYIGRKIGLSDLTGMVPRREDGNDS